MFLNNVAKVCLTSGVKLLNQSPTGLRPFADWYCLNSHLATAYHVYLIFWLDPCIRNFL